MADVADSGPPSGGDDASAQPYLFEVSWEAGNKGTRTPAPCTRTLAHPPTHTLTFTDTDTHTLTWALAGLVGGIYTVLKTKAPVTVDEYGGRSVPRLPHWLCAPTNRHPHLHPRTLTYRRTHVRRHIRTHVHVRARATRTDHGVCACRYCLLGPISKSSQMEVEEQPATARMARTIDAMAARGVRVMYGRWLIEGYPKVLLFDLGAVWGRLDEWRADFASLTQIPAPPQDSELNDAIVFGYLVAWFLGEVSPRRGQEQRGTLRVQRRSVGLWVARWVRGTSACTWPLCRSRWRPACL
jgi:hypothetical protein